MRARAEPDADKQGFLSSLKQSKTEPAMPDPLPPEKARQGRRGFPVVIVLVCALLLAMAVWWGVEIYGESLDAGQKVELQKSTDAPSTPTGETGKVGTPDNGKDLPPAN